MKNRICFSNKLILQICLACVVFGVLCCTAAAQRVEIFGGYQFTHLQPSYNANGWNASLTGNFKHVEMSIDSVREKVFHTIFMPY